MNTVRFYEDGTHYEVISNIFIAPCDFCGAETKSVTQYDKWHVSHWLVPIDGSGSDHLAIWCKDCGPQHRR